MFGYAFVTFYRTAVRHRLYTAINVLGLALGIAVFLVLALDVKFETSFEQWIPHAERIYVIRTAVSQNGRPFEPFNYTMGGLLEELRADEPQIHGSRIWGNAATVRQGATITPDRVEVVDPQFLEIFDLPMLAGDKRTALRHPDDLLVSATEARRYFGAARALGRRLTLSQQGQLRDYRVAGVFADPPKNTDLDLTLIVPMTPRLSASEPGWTHWGSSHLQTFLALDPARAAALDASLDAFTDRRARLDVGPLAHKTMRLRTARLRALHLIDPKDAIMVATLGTVGALTLLLAMINYVNLATARAALRAREVALRKVMGAVRGQLVVQFMAEAVLTAAVAALIALALCELALPAINAAGGLSLALGYGPRGVLPIAGAVVLIVGLSAGVYPALVLAGFRPAAVLASARTPGGGRGAGRLREALVVTQFAIAIVFSVATLVMLSQTRYLRTADLGFPRDGLIVVKSFDDPDVTASQRSALLDLWRRLPGVVGVTRADIAPGVDNSTSASNFRLPGAKGDDPTLNYVVAGPDFARTYGARFVAGRDLDPAHGLDDASAPPSAAHPGGGIAAPDASPRNIFVNVAALRTLGLPNARAAIGRRIEQGVDDVSAYRPLTIVGVIEDLHFRTPHRPPPATVYFMTTRDLDNASATIRYSGAPPGKLMAAMQSAWRRIAPATPFSAKTIQQNMANYYEGDERQARLFSMGAAIAVLIGCGGLFALASFATVRRTREIGVRKVLGASTADVLRLLVVDFLRPVALANLIAWPIAYLAMRGWLAGFAQRVELGPRYFLGASALALVIALATVTGHAWKVARAEPARALRCE